MILEAIQGKPCGLRPQTTLVSSTRYVSTRCRGYVARIARSSSSVSHRPCARRERSSAPAMYAARHLRSSSRCFWSARRNRDGHPSGAGSSSSRMWDIVAALWTGAIDERSVATPSQGELDTKAMSDGSAALRVADVGRMLGVNGETVRRALVRSRMGRRDRRVGVPSSMALVRRRPAPVARMRGPLAPEARTQLRPGSRTGRDPVNDSVAA